MVKALIFDLDNTLIDRQRAFKEMLVAKFSALTKDEKLLKAMVEDVMIWDANGTVTRDISLGKWADRYHYDPQIAEAICKDWADNSGKIVYTYPDVEETLTALKKKYLLAILSNGNAVSQRRKLKTLNLDYLFDYTLVSGECAYKKPQKEIFELVLKELDLKAEEAVYIGDTYDIDVVGARKAKIKPVYISRFNEIHEDVCNIFAISDLLKTDFEKLK